MRLALVGCGNMGFAMLQGWLKAGAVTAGDVTVIEPDAALRARAAGLGVEAADGPQGLRAFAPDLVILAVKPQVMREVTRAYREVAAAGATFLSIAAGISSDGLREMLGSGTAIIRCMPNTPAAIGKGLMAIHAGRDVPAARLAFAERLLAANGTVVRIEDEDEMHAVTAVSGSGPAYVFHFIEALTEAAKAAGLPADTAATLAKQTVHGAASLAFESAETPTRLREQVTSPNGTTAAALGVLMGGDALAKLLTEAVEAARKRSVELGT